MNKRFTLLSLAALSFLSFTNSAQAADKNPIATVDAPAKQDILIDREKQIWESVVKGDITGFADALSDDLIEITDHSFNTKADSVNEVKTCKMADVSFSDFKVLTVDPKTKIVIYRVSAKITPPEGQSVTIDDRASSTWTQRGGKWIPVFHQQTAAKDAKAAN